jgi:uncharacterized membrane protein YqaE (UPF0057 family)
MGVTLCGLYNILLCILAILPSSSILLHAIYQILVSQVLYTRQKITGSEW